MATLLARVSANPVTVFSGYSNKHGNNGKHGNKLVQTLKYKENNIMKIKFITNKESELNGQVITVSHVPVIKELMYCEDQWLQVEGIATNIKVSKSNEFNSYPEYQYIVTVDVLDSKPRKMMTDQEIKDQLLNN